jgi:hypothetical protein
MSTLRPVLQISGIGSGDFETNNTDDGVVFPDDDAV